MSLSAKEILDNLSWGKCNAEIVCEEQHEVAAMQLNFCEKWTSKWTGTGDEFRLTELVGGVSILQARGFILTKMQAFEKIKRIDDRYRKQKRQLKEVAARSEQQITRVAESQREGNLLLSQIAEHFVQKNRILADGVSVQKAAMHLAMERHAETSNEELEESADSCGEPEDPERATPDCWAEEEAKAEQRRQETAAADKDMDIDFTDDQEEKEKRRQQAQHKDDSTGEETPQSRRQRETDAEDKWTADMNATFDEIKNEPAHLLVYEGLPYTQRGGMLLDMPPGAFSWNEPCICASCTMARRPNVTVIHEDCR